LKEADYICLNGEFRKASEPCLFPHNRAFRYGDALYEDIHACATELQFPAYHLERLTGNMQLLSMHIPAHFSVALIRQLATQLLNKNRIFGGAAIRLTVFRDPVEDFVADMGRISFMLESHRIENEHFALNDKGLTIDVCSGFTKSVGPLSRIRSAYSLLYLLAGMEAGRKKHDSCILLNDAGRLVETPESNVFLISGNSLFTPGINQGCIPGVMRRVILELAGETGYRINDQCSLTPAALNDAEEVFLTGAIKGIQWVGAYQERRYYKKAAKILNEKLNERAFGNG
jgi:branched-chain amino acid aminotransferase